MSTTGFVYKIVSSIGDKIYIGSTVQGLNRRFWYHKYYFKNNDNKYRSFKLFEEYGLDTCSINMIESIEFKERHELFVRERYWIDNTDNCVNKLKPVYSEEEKLESKQKTKERQSKWFQENKNKENFKQKCRENSKRYADNNLDKVRERSRVYGQLHKEERSEKHKEWYANNKDKRSKDHKEWREKNSQVIECNCGGTYKLCDKSKHMATKRHNHELMNSLK